MRCKFGMSQVEVHSTPKNDRRSLDSQFYFWYWIKKKTHESYKQHHYSFAAGQPEPLAKQRCPDDLSVMISETASLFLWPAELVVLEMCSQSLKPSRSEISEAPAIISKSTEVVCSRQKYRAADPDEGFHISIASRSFWLRWPQPARGISGVKYWQPVPSELRVVVISWSNSASSRGVDRCRIIFIRGGGRKKTSFEVESGFVVM